MILTKTILASMLLALFAISGNTAHAWTRAHCDIASSMGHYVVSNDKYAKECHAFMIGDSVISSEDYAGNSWGDEYKHTNWVDTLSPDVTVKNKGVGLDNKFVFYYKGHEQHRTKRMSDNEFYDYIKKRGLDIKHINYWNEKDSKTYNFVLRGQDVAE